MYKKNLIKNNGVEFVDTISVLEEREEKFLSGNTKVFSVGEVWEELINRKNTFLTKN